MALDQPRRDQVAVQLDPLGARAGAGGHLGVRADERDPAVRDRQAPALVHVLGEHVDQRAAGDHQVGLGGAARDVAEAPERARGRLQADRHVSKARAVRDDAVRRPCVI